MKLITTKFAGDQIVVEAHALTVVRTKGEIGEIARPWAGGRAARAPKGESPRRKERQGAAPEQTSSLHNCSFAIPACPQGTMSHGTMSKRAIMAWSSCKMLWQCM